MRRGGLTDYSKVDMQGFPVQIRQLWTFSGKGGLQHLALERDDCRTILKLIYGVSGTYLSTLDVFQARGDAQRRVDRLF